MINKDGFTPREAAYSIAIDWVYSAHNKSTSDVDEASTTKKGNVSESFETKLKRQLAILHNELLDKSGLDGIAI